MSIDAWLPLLSGPWGYVLLAGACLIEVVFPPFPGDAVALGGVYLAVTAGLDPWLAYAALNLGSLVGGLAAYGLGRAIASGARPRFLESERAQATLERIQETFRAHGVKALALNRFVPALRALFFVGAGVARLPLLEVLVWGGLSSMAWNGLLFGVGAWIGPNLTRLVSVSRAMALVLFAALGAGVACVFAVRRRRTPP